jgi:hypothetical protein
VSDGIDPDAYFAERGYALRVEERNLDGQLPLPAPSRGSTHWADLVSRDDGREVAKSYGSGVTQEEAKLSALRRWQVEQERPEQLPHRLP